MSDSVRIIGLEDIRKTLVDVSPKEGRNIARRSVVRVARVVRDAVRDRAPVGPTGNLVRSIKSRRARGTPDEASAEIYADKSGGKTGQGHHWHLVEFGSGDRIVKSTGVNVGSMPAQPFITPTVEEYASKVPKMYQWVWWEQYAAEMKKRARKGPRL